MSDNIQYSEPFETILTLLAIAVLVDKKERDKELIEFYHCAKTHNQQLHPDQILCPDQIKMWFDNHKSHLSSRLRSDEAAEFQTEMLSRIGATGLQRQVLTSIFNISVADYELADTESDYLQLAVKVWKSPLPDAKEVTIYG